MKEIIKSDDPKFNSQSTQYQRIKSEKKIFKKRKKEKLNLSTRELGQPDIPLNKCMDFLKLNNMAFFSKITLFNHVIKKNKQSKSGSVRKKKYDQTHKLRQLRLPLQTRKHGH